MPRTGPSVRGVPVLKVLTALVVVVAAALAGLAWAISSPIGSSPDEDYHLASIWCPPPVETSGCQIQPGPHDSEIAIQLRVIAAPSCYAFYSEQSGACIWRIPSDSIGLDDRFDRGDYPPGFYHVMHVFAQGDPYSAIYRIRAFNVLLAVGLGALLVLAAARPTRRIMAYAVASTYVPMGMFLLPAANPSSWAILGLTVLGFGLHSYWLAETRGRLVANGALAALGAVLASSARADAALYSILAAVALSCLHYRSVRRHPIRLVLPLAVAVLGVLVYGSASQGAHALSGSGLGPDTTTKPRDLFLGNLLDSPSLLFGNEGFNNLGWLDTPLPPLVTVSMLAVCAFLIMAGVSRMSWMKALVTVGGMAAVAAIPLYVLQVSHLHVGQGVQSRYILPLLPVVSLVLLTGRRPQHAVRLSRGAAWVAWALVSIANSVALLTNIRRYTTGLDGPILPSGSPEWWSTSLSGPTATWILGSIAFGVCAWMIVPLSSGSDVHVAATTDVPTEATEDRQALPPAAPAETPDGGALPSSAPADDAADSGPRPTTRTGPSATTVAAPAG